MLATNYPTYQLENLSRRYDGLGFSYTQNLLKNDLWKTVYDFPLWSHLNFGFFMIFRFAFYAEDIHEEAAVSSSSSSVSEHITTSLNSCNGSGATTLEDVLTVYYSFPRHRLANWSLIKKYLQPLSELLRQWPRYRRSWCHGVALHVTDKYDGTWMCRVTIHGSHTRWQSL